MQQNKQNDIVDLAINTFIEGNIVEEAQKSRLKTFINQLINNKGSDFFNSYKNDKLLNDFCKSITNTQIVDAFKDISTSFNSKDRTKINKAISKLQRLKDRFEGKKKDLNSDQVVFFKNSECEGMKLNDIPFKTATQEDLNKLLHENQNSSPTIPKDYRVGVIVKEKDGRIWIHQPKDHKKNKQGFYDKQYEFSRGAIEDGYNAHQTAIKEAYEEMGLLVQPSMQFIDDKTKENEPVRYYICDRVGGNPTKWDKKNIPSQDIYNETSSVILATPQVLRTLFSFNNPLARQGHQDRLVLEKYENKQGINIPQTATLVHSKDDFNVYVTSEIADSPNRLSQNDFTNFATHLSNTDNPLFIDVDSSEDCNNFTNKFTNAGFIMVDGKEKTYNYKFNNEEFEYKLYKFVKDSKFVYGIKANSIEDSLEVQDKLFAFSKHLQERHLNSGKYKNVVFNCFFGFSRSVTLAINHALSLDAKDKKNQNKPEEVVQKILNARQPVVGYMQNTNSPVFSINNRGITGMPNHWFNNEANIIKGFEGYGATPKTDVHNNANKIKDTASKYTDLQSSYYTNIRDKAFTNTFTQRVANLNKITQDNKEASTTINKLNKDTWLAGFKNRLAELQLDDLKKMTKKLNTGDDINTIFKSSRLNALAEAGEKEQLKRLKARALKLTEEAIEILNTSLNSSSLLSLDDTTTNNNIRCSTPYSLEETKFDAFVEQKQLIRGSRSR